MLKYLLLVSLCLAQGLASNVEITPGDLELHAELQRLGVTPKDLTSNIREVFEKLRAKMLNGDPETNFPVMDPFVFQDSHINYAIKDTNIWINALLNEGDARGLAGWEYGEMKVTLIPLRVLVEITFPHLTATAKQYDVDGNLAVIPLYGKGNFTADAKDFSFKVDITLTGKNGGVIVKNFDMDIGLYCIDIQAEGLLGGDLGKVVLDVINFNFPDLLIRFKMQYWPQIISQLTNFVNKLLEGKTVADIMCILQNNCPTTTAAPVTSPAY